MRAAHRLTWDASLLGLSLGMMVLFGGSELCGHLIDAEAIAEDLSPRINVDENALRNHIEDVLEPGAVRRVIITSSPFALISAVLVARLAVDLAARRRETSRQRQPGR